MTPTAEQLAIIEAAQNTTSNLACIARAGAAKTTTLVLIAQALPKVDILCLSFNKAIAVEMNARLPANCEAKTLHALGYKAWYNFTRKKTTVTASKVYHLTKATIEAWDDLGEKAILFEEISDILQAIATGKNYGWLPEAYKGHWKPLTTDDELEELLPMTYSPAAWDVIKSVSVQSFKQALSGTLDFDDMVFCSAICSVSWPSPTLTLVDESQDLSSLNHHILSKIVKNRRVIAVGDPCQAIYGFRGASTNSMSELTRQFSMTTFYLTMTFRCASSIVTNAHWRAPDMVAYPSNAVGEVLRPITWQPDDITDGNAVICRNNAPLFALAIRLIRDGRLPKLSGRDVGQAIKKVMAKLGKKATPKAEALEALVRWEAAELAKAKDGAKGRVKDMTACIEVILAEVSFLGEATTYLDHLLAREGRINLMTGHKAKGLEFDSVFFLDQQLCRMKYEQDQNLKYVIETRAKTRLVYVTSESYVSGSVA